MSSRLHAVGDFLAPVGRCWLRILMGCYYATLTCVGLIGFRDPSQSIAEALGAGYLIYAFGMTIIGLMALAAVITGNRKGEVVCLAALGLLTALHGGLLLAGGEPGYQSGLRIMAGIFGFPVLAYYRYSTVWTRADIARSLRARTRMEEADSRLRDSDDGGR